MKRCQTADDERFHHFRTAERSTCDSAQVKTWSKQRKEGTQTSGAPRYLYPHPHRRTNGSNVWRQHRGRNMDYWTLCHRSKILRKCVIFRKRCIRGGMKRLRTLSPRWTSWTTDLPGSVGVSLVLRHSPRDCCFGHDFRSHAKVVATFFATQSAKERTRCCIHLCCTRS